MLKKVATSLFLVIYLSVSAVSFAEEVALEIISEAPTPVVETVPEPVPQMVDPIVDNIPEEIISDTPPVEDVIPLVSPWDVSVPIAEDVPVSQEVPLSPDVEPENVPEPTLVENIIDLLNVAPEETMEEIVEDIPTTEIPLPTIPVEVEENSIFTPPGPEPEPWQPAVREDPTTESNTPVWDTETQSDPVFLAENSVFVRRMIESVVVDPTAKHSCKVDVFRTDVSASSTSLLSVKFYGTSILAAYDAEIGSLPNGIDVRFEKNNDYIYDFRGKETTLQLVVNNQDDSLTGDFTIPIIYTYKGKKESTVICQLNIINEEEEVIPVPVILPIVELVEPVVDPAQELVEEILESITPEPVTVPVVETQPPTTIDTILDILLPEEETPEPIKPPEVIPSREEQGPLDPPVEVVPPEPVIDPLVPPIDLPDVLPPVVDIIPEPVPEIVTPVIEIPPIVESPPISPSDVSST